MLSSFRKLAILPTNAPIARTILSGKNLHPTKFTSMFSRVPPRPSSGWQVFLTDNLREKKFPAERVADITKGLGNTWRNMSDAEKNVYTEKFLKAAKIHDDMYNEILRNASPQAIYEENLLRKKYDLKPIKDPKKPAKPWNSFILFFHNFRKEHPEQLAGMSLIDQSLKATKVFMALPSAEKEKYQKAVEEANAEYRKKMDEYNAQIEKFNVTKKSTSDKSASAKGAKAPKQEST
ncbi:hypothetical protein CLU79DRAFT_762767 [Phycomyces nitens]|nr:hypothetical protein CLU79DRAFT_762767 [Phycomyces nitens]